eukprot:747773-Hanusia_phi.AAC.6
MFTLRQLCSVPFAPSIVIAPPDSLSVSRFPGAAGSELSALPGPARQGRRDSGKLEAESRLIRTIVNISEGNGHVERRQGAGRRGEGEGRETELDGGGMDKFMVGTLNYQSGKHPSHQDGSVKKARFSSPHGVTSRPRGSAHAGRVLVQVTDPGNNAVRLVDFNTGEVSSLKPGLWRTPTGICTVPNGTETALSTLLVTGHTGYVVCDTGHHRLIHLSFCGQHATVLAGSGRSGHMDGASGVVRVIRGWKTLHSQVGMRGRRCSALLRASAVFEMEL